MWAIWVTAYAQHNIKIETYWNVNTVDSFTKEHLEGLK